MYAHNPKVFTSFKAWKSCPSLNQSSQNAGRKDVYVLGTLEKEGFDKRPLKSVSVCAIFKKNANGEVYRVDWASDVRFLGSRGGSGFFFLQCEYIMREKRNGMSCYYVVVVVNGEIYICCGFTW